MQNLPEELLTRILTIGCEASHRLSIGPNTELFQTKGRHMKEFARGISVVCSRWKAITARESNYQFWSTNLCLSTSDYRAAEIQLLEFRKALFGSNNSDLCVSIRFIFVGASVVGARLIVHGVMMLLPYARQLSELYMDMSTMELLELAPSFLDAIHRAPRLHFLALGQDGSCTTWDDGVYETTELFDITLTRNLNLSESCASLSGIAIWSFKDSHFFTKFTFPTTLTYLAILISSHSPRWDEAFKAIQHLPWLQELDVRIAGVPDPDREIITSFVGTKQTLEFLHTLSLYADPGPTWSILSWELPKLEALSMTLVADDEVAEHIIYLASLFTLDIKLFIPQGTTKNPLRILQFFITPALDCLDLGLVLEDEDSSILEGIHMKFPAPRKFILRVYSDRACRRQLLTALSNFTTHSTKDMSFIITGNGHFQYVEPPVDTFAFPQLDSLKLESICGQIHFALRELSTPCLTKLMISDEDNRFFLYWEEFPIFPDVKLLYMSLPHMSLDFSLCWPLTRFPNVENLVLGIYNQDNAAEYLADSLAWFMHREGTGDSKLLLLRSLKSLRFDVYTSAPDLPKFENLLRDIITYRSQHGHPLEEVTYRHGNVFKRFTL